MACLEQSKKLFLRGYVDINYLDNWPFGILTKRNDLEDTTKKSTNKKFVGNANLHFNSGHR